MSLVIKHKYDNPLGWDVVDGIRLTYLKGFENKNGVKAYILDRFVCVWVPFDSSKNRDKDYRKAKAYILSLPNGQEILDTCELHHAFDGRIGYIPKPYHRFQHLGYFYFLELSKK